MTSTLLPTPRSKRPRLPASSSTADRNRIDVMSPSALPADAEALHSSSELKISTEESCEGACCCSDQLCALKPCTQTPTPELQTLLFLLAWLFGVAVSDGFVKVYLLGFRSSVDGR